MEQVKRRFLATTMKATTQHAKRSGIALAGRVLILLLGILGNMPLTTFAQGQPPVVDSASVLTGPSKGGTEVILSGQHFAPDAILFVGGQPALETSFISPNQIGAITPPGSVGNAEMVLKQLPDHEVSAGTFAFSGAVPGDVDGDQELTMVDVSEAMKVATGEAPLFPVHLSSDVNGDGKIGLAEARAAMMNVTNPEFRFVENAAEPEVVVALNGGVQEPQTAAVKNLGIYAPAEVHWGDGAVTEVLIDSFVSHEYEEPGNYGVELHSAWGVSVPQIIDIDPPKLELVDVVLRFLDPATGEPLEDRSIIIDPQNPQPPVVVAELFAFGHGVDEIEIGLGFISGEGPLGNIDGLNEPGAVRLDPVPGEEVRVAVIQVPVQVNPQAPGVTTIKVNLDNSNAGDAATPQARFSLPLTVLLPSNFNQQHCDEIINEYEVLDLLKTAKKRDCEALLKQIDALCDQIEGIDTVIGALDAVNAGLQSGIDAKRTQITDKVADINRFFGDAATLTGYQPGGDELGDGEHIGFRRNGAARGFGFKFNSANGLSGRMSDWESVHGTRIGEELYGLRELQTEIDQASQQIADNNAAKANLEAQKANLEGQKDQLILDYLACLMECEDLDAEIEFLVKLAFECLGELHARKKVQDAIDDAKRASEEAEEEAGKSDAEGDEADSVIGGSSGTPEQLGEDSDDVQQGRDQVEEGRGDNAEAETLRGEAQDQADEADETPDGAESDALRAEADAKAAEARAKAEEAREKIKAGRAAIRDAKVRAAKRKKRVAPEGEEYCERVSYLHHSLRGISIEPLGTRCGYFDRLRDAADRLFTMLDLLNKAAGKLKLGTATLPVKETATRIMDEFESDAIDRRGLNLELCLKWVMQRVVVVTKYRCINGCWAEVERTRTVDFSGKPYLENSGTLPYAAMRAETEGKLKELLANAINAHQTSIIARERIDCD
jgi:hypothetical protein